MQSLSFSLELIWSVRTVSVYKGFINNAPSCHLIKRPA